MSRLAKAYVLGCVVPEGYDVYMKHLLESLSDYEKTFIRLCYSPYQPKRNEDLKRANREGFLLADTKSLPAGLKGLKADDLIALGVMQAMKPSEEFWLPLPPHDPVMCNFDLWRIERDRKTTMLKEVKALVGWLRNNETDAPIRAMEIKTGDGKQVVYDVGLEPRIGDEDAELIREYIEKVMQILTGRAQTSVPVGPRVDGKRRRLVLLPSYIGKQPEDLSGKIVPKEGEADTADKMDVISRQAFRGYLDESVLDMFFVSRQYSIGDSILSNAARREIKVIEKLTELATL